MQYPYSVCTLMTGVEKVGMHMLIKHWDCLYPNSHACEVTHHSIMRRADKAKFSHGFLTRNACSVSILSPLEDKILQYMLEM